MAGLLTHGRGAIGTSSPTGPSQIEIQWLPFLKERLAGQKTVHSCGGSAGFDLILRPHQLPFSSSSQRNHQTLSYLWDESVSKPGKWAHFIFKDKPAATNSTSPATAAIF